MLTSNEKKKILFYFQQVCYRVMLYALRRILGYCEFSFSPDVFDISLYNLINNHLNN